MAHTFSFEKLEVWHLAQSLAQRIYFLTGKFPEEEKYGIISQLRRAAVSVSSNLTEGSARTLPREQARFSQMAYSSLMELTSQLYLSQKLGFLKSEELENQKTLILELSNKINSLRNSQLRKIREPGIPYNDNISEDNDLLTTENQEQYPLPEHLNKSTNQLLKKNGYHYHPTATIDPGAKIGENTRIWHYSHIMGNAEIGADCNFGQNVFVANGVKIGRGVKVQNNVSIYEGVCCEDEVFIGPSVVFTNVINPRSGVVRKTEYQTTMIGKGASIGANATILCGLNIGAYAFIGAGAIVTKDIPPYALIRGNPAQQMGWMSEYGCKLEFNSDDDTVCPESGEVYQLINQSVRKVSKCN